MLVGIVQRSWVYGAVYFTNRESIDRNNTSSWWIISVLALELRLVAASDLNHCVLERYQEQEPVSSNDSFFFVKWII